MNKLTFLLDDKANDRSIEFSVTIGDGIASYFAAFESFLLAVGYTQMTIDAMLGGE